MKTTEHFKKVISEKLQEIASKDELFAENLKKENKNIDDCITYILNTVQKSGCNGFTDDEIFNMAVHYYDEDLLDVGKPVNCNVVVNHTVELSSDEIEQAKKLAMEKAVASEMQRLKKKPTVKKPEQMTVTQQTLF
jgi:hypothetical protein